MTIGTPTILNGSAIGDDVSISSPGVSLTAGRLVLVLIGRYSGSSDPIVLGDVSNTGTATISDAALHRNDNGTTGGGAYASTLIWSALVTGSGTFTATVSGHPAGSYIILGILEVPGTWNSSRYVAGNGNIQTTASATVTSGSASSTGPALFVAVCQLNTGTSSIGEDTNWTSVYKNVATDTGAISYRIVSGATTDSCDWVPANNVVYGAAIAVFQEAASGYNVTCEQGSYTLTGQNANTLLSRIVTAEQGSYALNGQAVTISVSAARNIPMETGYYTIVGSEALVDLSVVCEPGSYSYTGYAANINYTPLLNPTVVCEQGSYSLSGQNMLIKLSRVLTAVQGSYSLTGFAANITYSGMTSSSGRGLKLGLGLRGMKIS